ncbi:MAG: Na+/H+ antiporter NhaC, partial [Pseudohongiellaceae bacterium]
MPSSSSPPSLAGAIAPIALTMALLMVQIFVLSGPPHIPLILGTGIAALFGLVRGCRWGDIQEGIVSAAATSIPVVFIFLLVGMTIGTWILAGTVPLMITLGVKWI